MTQFLLGNILAPAVTSAGAIFVWQRWRGSGGRDGLGFAVALATLVGYYLLPDVPVWPERHWHWLPFVGLFFAALFESVENRSVWVRLALLLIACGVTSWLLVPLWADFMPRPRLILLLAIYFGIVTLGTEHMFVTVKRSPWATMCLMLFASINALFIAKSVSVTYGRFAAITSAAMAGSAMVMWRRRERSSAKCSSRSASWAFASLVGGVGFVGCIYPEPPLFRLMLIPLLPIAFAAIGRIVSSRKLKSKNTD